MAKCSDCGRSFGMLELKNGICKSCAEKQEEKRSDQGNTDASAEDLKSIVLTTETANSLEISERIEIITAECAFGMNAFRDLFSAGRDFFGGRSKSTQNVLRDARKTVLTELRREAHDVGANAVVGVDLDYSEFSGGGKSMLFVVASGTAVKAKL